MWSHLTCVQDECAFPCVTLGRPSSDPQRASPRPLGVFLLPLCSPAKPGSSVESNSSLEVKWNTNPAPLTRWKEQQLSGPEQEGSVAHRAWSRRVSRATGVHVGPTGRPERCQAQHFLRPTWPFAGVVGRPQRSVKRLPDRRAHTPEQRPNQGERTQSQAATKPRDWELCP